MHNTNKLSKRQSIHFVYDLNIKLLFIKTVTLVIFKIINQICFQDYPPFTYLIVLFGLITLKIVKYYN